MNDYLKLKLGTLFMKKTISKWISKFIKTKTEKDVEVCLNELNFEVRGETVLLHIDSVLRLTKNDFDAILSTLD